MFPFPPVDVVLTASPPSPTAHVLLAGATVVVWCGTRTAAAQLQQHLASASASTSTGGRAQPADIVSPSTRQALLLLDTGGDQAAAPPSDQAAAIFWGVEATRVFDREQGDRVVLWAPGQVAVDEKPILPSTQALLHVLHATSGGAALEQAAASKASSHGCAIM